jgi:hypothetical protein
MKSIILLTAAMSLIANIAEKDWIIILAEWNLNHLASSRIAFITTILVAYSYPTMY